MTMVNAGHPPLIIIPAQEGPPHIWSGNGVFLGMFPNTQANYHEQNKQLEPGDKVLLYTDGLPFEAASELLVEAVRSPAEGIARGLEHIDNGPNANDKRIAVIPQGPYVLATVRGQKRALGGTPAL